MYFNTSEEFSQIIELSNRSFDKFVSERVQKWGRKGGGV